MAYRPLKPIPEEIWWTALNEIFKASEVEADSLQQKKIFYQILATMCKYLYDNADYKFRLGYIDLYKKGMNPKSLMTIELNRPDEIGTAEAFEKFYTCGGLEAEELQEGVNNFIESMTHYDERMEEEEALLAAFRKRYRWWKARCTRKRNETMKDLRKKLDNSKLRGEDKEK